MMTVQLDGGSRNVLVHMAEQCPSIASAPMLTPLKATVAATGEPRVHCGCTSEPLQLILKLFVSNCAVTKCSVISELCLFVEALGGVDGISLKERKHYLITLLSV